MYHFISGYTAKVAGTEVGVNEPKPTSRPVSARRSWFGIRPNMPKCGRENATTRTTPGSSTPAGPAAYGVGKRIKLAYTRAIIDAIHSGELAKTPTVEDPYFGLSVPLACPGVPASVLQPATVEERPRRLRRHRPQAGPAVRREFFQVRWTAQFEPGGPK